MKSLFLNPYSFRKKSFHRTPDTITDQEKAREKEIMEELVALVNKRDEMIETIELERQRVEKESESNNNSLTLNTQSPAKGVVRNHKIYRTFF